MSETNWTLAVTGWLIHPVTSYRHRRRYRQWCRDEGYTP